MIEELGLCQSKILLVPEVVLPLPCSLPFAVKVLILMILDKERNIPRLNIFESFLGTFCKKWPRLCLPNCKKMCGENTNQCVQLWKVLYFPQPALLPFSCLCLTWNNLLDHSFRPSHCSLSDLLSLKPTLIYSVLVPSFGHHLSCWLFFYFLLPLGLLHYGHCNRLLKKKKKATLYFNLFCELCLFSEPCCLLLSSVCLF